MSGLLCTSSSLQENQQTFSQLNFSSCIQGSKIYLFRQSCYLITFNVGASLSVPHHYHRLRHHDHLCHLRHHGHRCHWNAGNARNCGSGCSSTQTGIRMWRHTTTILLLIRLPFYVCCTGCFFNCYPPYKFQVQKS